EGVYHGKEFVPERPECSNGGVIPGFDEGGKQFEALRMKGAHSRAHKALRDPSASVVRMNCEAVDPAFPRVVGSKYRSDQATAVQSAKVRAAIHTQLMGDGASAVT